uniref:NADH-ubiquinone oxidoreductase chain 4L n=1 Tax=Argas sp. SpringbokSA-QMS95171 TaxID=1442167 RepID=W0FHU2_9ACAR|nr:NADH dehydrogenase subunit 4L [Argas sp. SpringbokSA-QMS95171]
MIIMSLVSFMFGFLSFLVNHKHMLMLLLCFEFMYLCTFILLMLIVGLSGMFLNVILYLIIIVCEASLGLSILVVAVFFYGNDKVSSMSILKC